MCHNFCKLLHFYGSSCKSNHQKFCLLSLQRSFWSLPNYKIPKTVPLHAIWAPLFKVLSWPPLVPPLSWPPKRLFGKLEFLYAIGYLAPRTKLRDRKESSSSWPSYTYICLSLVSKYFSCSFCKQKRILCKQKRILCEQKRILCEQNWYLLWAKYVKLCTSL